MRRTPKTAKLFLSKHLGTFFALQKTALSACIFAVQPYKHHGKGYRFNPLCKKSRLQSHVFFMLCLFAFICNCNLYAVEAEKPQNNPPQQHTTQENKSDTKVSDTKKHEKTQSANKDTPTEKSDNGFYSIEENGFTVAHDSTWEFTSFDSFGRIAFIVLFEKDTQIEKTDFEYWDDSSLLQKKTRNTQKTTSISDYNNHGLIIKNVITAIADKKILETATYLYDNNNRLTKKIVTSDDRTIETRHSYTANGARTKSETYRDGIQIMLREYTPDGNEHVYIFERGVKYLVSKKDARK